MWKESIDKVGEVTAAKESEESKRQNRLSVPCLAYRSLLPACPSPPPVRGPEWIRQTMRSILTLAVQKGINNTDAPTTHFPNIAYRFIDTFSPMHPSALVEGLSLLEPCVRINKRDEKKWSLYFGVKEMAAENAEASLFFQLLDESYGQDFFAFIMHVLVEIDKEGYFESTCTTSSTGSTSAVQDEIAGVEEILIPVPEALQLASSVFADSTNLAKNILNLPLQANSLSKDGGGVCNEDEPSVQSVNLFELIVLVLAGEYRDELQSRKSLARLLFNTAATGALTSYVPRLHVESDREVNAPIVHNVLSSTSTIHAMRKEEQCTVNFPQFEAIMKVLWESISGEETDELYRMAYEVQQNMNTCKETGRCTSTCSSTCEDLPPDGVSFTAFLRAADERRFFYRSRSRLLHSNVPVVPALNGDKT